MSDHVPNSSCDPSPHLTGPVQTDRLGLTDEPLLSPGWNENDDLIYEDPAPMTEEHPAHSAPRRSVTWHLPAADGGS